MYSYAFTTLVLCISFFTSSSKIINGYEKDIQSARRSLPHLEALPRSQEGLRRLEEVRLFIMYFELTQALLNQFKDISPALYNQIDTIADAKGRTVDVYVKFVPRSGVPEGALGVTNINQSANDPDGYLSEYGLHTVSVKICIVKASLTILAHEFGHISYQAPNLASYVAFFARNYPDQHIKASYLGHKPNDPSAASAVAFERIFRRHFSDYLKKTGNTIASPPETHDEIEGKFRINRKRTVRNDQ